MGWNHQLVIGHLVVNVEDSLCVALVIHRFVSWGQEFEEHINSSSNRASLALHELHQQSIQCNEGILVTDLPLTIGIIAVLQHAKAW